MINIPDAAIEAAALAYGTVVLRGTLDEYLRAAIGAAIPILTRSILENVVKEGFFLDGQIGLEQYFRDYL